MKNIVNRALVAKKKQFQSKSVPRGTRTIWNYLGALILLFSLGIGNVWGANGDVLFNQSFDETGAGSVAYAKSTARAYTTAEGKTLAKVVETGTNYFTSITCNSKDKAGIGVNNSTGGNSKNYTGKFGAYYNNTSGYWSICRTSNFASTAPTAIKVEMNAAFNPVSSGSNTGMQIAIGSEFTDGLTNSCPALNKCVAGFSLPSNNSIKISKYVASNGITNISTSTLEAGTSYKYTWIINNTTSSLTYKDPNNNDATVAAGCWDLWVGTTLYCNDITKTTTGMSGTTLQNIYIGSPFGKKHEFILDDIKVTDLSPAAPETHMLTWIFAGGSTTSTTHTAAGQVAEGATITYPANNTMSKDGYDFAGWSTSVATMPKTDLTITALWTEHTTASTNANLSALSVAGCELNETFNPATTAYTISLPFYGVMPAASAVTATKEDSHASDPVVSVEGNVITVEVTPESGAAGKKTYTITVNIADAPTASSSINIEQLVLDNSKAYNIGAALETAHIGYANKNDLDSLSTAAERNEPYLGLKFKSSSSTITIIVPANETLKVKFGARKTTVKVAINDGAVSDASISNNIYSLAAASAVRKVKFSVTENNKTIVLKQIMVGEDIKSVQLPWLVTYDAGEHGTCATAKEVWWGTALTLPTATPEDGWSFNGWKDDENNAATSPYTPTKDVVLTAQYTALASPFDLTALTYKIGTADAVNVGYEDGTFTYNIELPYANYDAITVAPTLKESTSYLKGDEVLTVSSLPGAATFTVVAAGGSSEQLYTVNFSTAPKDGVCIVKADLAAGSSAASITATSGAYKDADNIAINVAKDLKLGSTGDYVKVAVKDTYFQDGDVVEIVLRTDKSASAWLQIFADEGTTLVAEMKSGVSNDTPNHLTISGVPENISALYLYRTEAADGDMNPYPTSMAVYRAMNPVLTAITINGRDGEIDALDDKHFTVTIPNDANLASLTVVPTIVRNAAHATTPEAVISNEGAWVLTADGDNTYRIMDKDGDYTDYTITLVRDVLKHTVRFMDGTSEFASALVVDGESPVAPATDPTKEDYLFQGWAETVDGDVITDWSAISISAAKDFYAKWVSDGAIKLIEAGAINTTNFVTGGTLSSGTVSVDEVDYKYITLAGTNGEIGSASNVTTDRFVMYHATTTKTKIQIHAYANGNARQVRLSGLVEGASTLGLQQTIDVAKNDDELTEYFSFDSDKHRTFYITIPSSASDVYLLQVKVIESGEPLAAIGTAGTSFNFNKGRLFAPQSVATSFDGIDIKTYNKYAALSTEYAELSDGAISFYVPNDVCLSVASNANGTNKYYVTNEVTGTDNETTTANAEFNLTGGKTWYIRLADSNKRVRFTNIAFTAPKCEKPTITAQPQTKQTFGPGNLTATVVAATPTDGGTLKYQWYKAADDSKVDGATEATLTTTTEGTYYVIVTNTLADHSDNSVKSESATLGYRVMDDATLKSLKYGTTAITLVDGVYDYNVELAKGTTDVPALAATATMNGYANVAINNATAFVNYEASSTVTVKSEDLTETNVYTVNFYVKHDLPQVDVTGSTVWDWTNAATTMQTIKPATKNVEQLMANIDDNGKKLKNDDEFNSQALIFSGQEALVGNSTRWYAKGGHIKFNVTVPGIVKVEFSDNGGNNRRLKINNLVSDVASASETDVKTYAAYVEAGEVTLMGVKNDGTGTDQYIRISKITFTAKATPDYSRDVTNNIGTLCVDHNVLAGGALGATFYQIASRNELYNDKIDFEEVLPNEELKAGEPYIFKSTTGKIELFYGATVADAPVAVHGMIGSFANTTLDITEANKSDILYIAQNKLWNCEDLVTSDLEVVANRAYIVMSDVPTYAEYQEAQTSNPAPRRRVTLGRNAEQVATGIEDVQGDKVQCTKMLINGQLFILRGEKMYDAKGQLVK